MRAGLHEKRRRLMFDFWLFGLTLGALALGYAGGAVSGGVFVWLWLLAWRV